MIILGLAGAAGVGKDTVADYLVERYGFVKFAFSDALYAEVQQAYNLPDQALLRDRATKAFPQRRLDLTRCEDHAFFELSVLKLCALGTYYPSPRQILQWWGTDYRRAQDPDYWVRRAADSIWQVQSIRYPEQRPMSFVECGTRFENERAWIRSEYHHGNIWHIHNSRVASADPHVSAQLLPVLDGERELWNNDTIERLHRGVDLLMTTSARFVRVEPMLPNEASS
ncbi:MAG: hypothetical protein DDT20_00930 [Firmicutes bacterium]|nr:hypothetical protein [Bacillota bacterium]